MSKHILTRKDKVARAEGAEGVVEARSAVLYTFGSLTKLDQPLAMPDMPAGAKGIIDTMGACATRGTALLTSWVCSSVCPARLRHRLTDRDRQTDTDTLRQTDRNRYRSDRDRDRDRPR